MKKGTALLAIATIVGFGLTANHVWAGSGGGSCHGKGHGMKMADTDGNGTISAEEWQAHRTERFKAIDTDKDGFLSVDEVIQAKKAKRRAHMQSKLNRLDSDGDGKVDAKEFAAGKPGMGKHRCGMHSQHKGMHHRTMMGHSAGKGSGQGCGMQRGQGMGRGMGQGWGQGWVPAYGMYPGYGMPPWAYGQQTPRWVGPNTTGQ
ncbi:EF-hand domain-containing protein [Magnetococcus sp. PR-3]|uniref:EF-hand domain-containing protein n=1 Tax=Magnetococcus sp. PR-3 TaxID=3120355 RepID=UPI002FCDE3B1